MSTDTSLPDSRTLGPDTLATGHWTPTPTFIPVWQRLALFLVGLLLIALLVTAARLPPNPAGMGTHQGLGLPPCSFVIWFGIRCPACGMTTSWAYLLRGQLIQSAAANTGGMLLALSAIAGAPWMLTSSVRGQWWIAPLSPQWLVAGSGVITFVTTVQWCWRLLQ